MDTESGFFPDAARAVAMDRRMRAGLADSLEYLATTIEQQLVAECDGLDALVRRMRAGALYPASTFGLYYEATSALIDGDSAQALALLAELAGEQPLASSELRIVSLDEAAAPANVKRYQRLMDNDPLIHFGFSEPPAPLVASARTLVAASLRRLRRIDPVLVGEFEALVRELILVVGESGVDYQFAGGSSYTLWGALFLNAEHHTSEVAVIEALAHESAHSLLFGFCHDEPLVNNADDELFSSPLRVDPRPMDGIYHATYVSARMYRVLSVLLESGDLSADETAFVRSARDEDEENFFAGLGVVREYALLTGTGRALMAEAEVYMRSVCGR